MRILNVIVTAVLLAGMAVLPGCERESATTEVFAEEHAAVLNGMNGDLSGNLSGSLSGDSSGDSSGESSGETEETTSPSESGESGESNEKSNSNESSGSNESSNSNESSGSNESSSSNESSNSNESSGSNESSESNESSGSNESNESNKPGDDDLTVGPDDYLQAPPIVYSPVASVQARGIYVTSNSAGLPGRLEDLIALCQESGMNAMVIDIRTENEITMTNWIDFADEWGIAKNFMPDGAAVLAQLEEAGIYTIARMVTFLDGYTVDFRPELYIHNQDGSIWMGPKHNGNKRYPWLNPYNKDTWDYVLTYAKAAAELGFKEIQFDYVRFAATKTLEDADFGDTGGLSRTEAIVAFLEYAKAVLQPYKVKISADVYGTVINSDLDAGIVGQDYAAMARVLDVICPMVYPSHFAGGTYGVAYPDTDPYAMIYNAMVKSEERLTVIPEGEHRAVVRPWLQDFTASYLKPHYLNYGPAERQAQIQAVYDAGLSEWLLWDPGNRYEVEGVIHHD